MFEGELKTNRNICLKVVKGDTTDVTCDVIVNPTNEHLQLGGGVSGSILKKG